nr:hypothetical protein [Tanacetum cinerariifolium]
MLLKRPKENTKCVSAADEDLLLLSISQSCWSSVVESNDVTRLQALVDRKKVVITEAAIRDVLRLDDADGVDCLPNEEIFAELAPDIAVSGDDVQDQYIPSPTPPTPTPQQPQDLPSTSQVGTSQRIKSSADTDMKDTSNHGRMIADLDRDIGVALIDDEGTEKKAEDAQVAGDKQFKGRQAEIYQIDMDHASKVLSIQEDEPKVQEVVDVVTTAKLITEVVVAVSKSVTAASATIAAAIIAAAPVRVAAASTRKRKGVVIRDPKEESTAIIPAETKSKDKGKRIMVEEPKPMKKKQQVKMDEEYARKLHEELNKDINWSVAIDHVKQKAKEDSYVQRYHVMKKKPQTEAQAQRNMIMYLKNVVGFRLDYFKGMSYDNIRPIFEAKFNLNIERKLNEEVEELKHYLEIVPDEDADVYTEATPLARKVSVVDYQSIQLNNKPHYKIIRADRTHQLAAKQKLMLLDSAAERRSMLLSQDKTVNDKCCC